MLYDKLIAIETAHKIAKQNLDLTNLVKIENGKIKKITPPEANIRPRCGGNPVA